MDKVIEKDHSELFCIKVLPPAQEVCALEIVRKWEYTCITGTPKPFSYTLLVIQTGYCVSWGFGVGGHSSFILHHLSCGNWSQAMLNMTQLRAFVWKPNSHQLLQIYHEFIRAHTIMVLLHPALASCALLLQTKRGNSQKVGKGSRIFWFRLLQALWTLFFSMLCFHPYFTWNVIEKMRICWSSNLPNPSSLLQQEITAIRSELFSWNK